MARVRLRDNVAHDLPWLGRTVQPDEVVDVDDDVFAERLWPEGTWAIVDAPRSAPSTPPARSASKADWVEYATTVKGADPDAISELTRDELAAEFGG